MRYSPYEFKRDDAFRFATFKGIEVNERGDELHFKYCPYCQGGGHDQYTFAISLLTGQFKCMRNGCGRSGNMIILSQDFGFSLGGEVDAYFTPKKRYKTYKKVENPPVPKPEIIKYLESRGISEETAKKYEIASWKKDDNTMAFLFYDPDGNLCFIKYRKTNFDPSKDKNKEWCDSGGKPVLFGIKQCNPENDTLIITEGQCFDGKAEVLTPNGWIRLEDYAGQDVLQVYEDMHGEFVRPKRYIVKRHIGKMVNVAIGGNYESYTTDDHNLVYIDPKGRIHKAHAIDHVSTAWKIPTAIYIDSSEYANWTDDMFALYIAISADGTIDYRKGTGYNKPKSERFVRIALPLERKANRLREILNNLGIDYTDNLDSKGYNSICFHCPNWMKSKYLPYEFATKTSLKQKKFILDEMVKWDGNKVNGRNQYEYTSIIKHNIDVMQLIASSCGYMSTVMNKQNGGNGNFKKSYCYKLSILLGKNYISGQQLDNHKVITEVDQRVYCVTVDTGMILVRWNNKISVSGNCDSLSVAEAGFENAVSVPTGAKGFTWVPHCWDWVHQYKRIIVFGDYEKNHITLLDDIKRRFRQLRIQHVREEDYKDCKDANDILRKYGKEQIRACIENAVDIPVNNVISLADVEEINPFDIPKLQTGISQLDKLLYGGLPFGGIAIITGKAGEGKSVLASQILVSAMDNGHRVFAYSGELPNHLFKAWMTFQVAGKDHVFTYQTKFGETGYNISPQNKQAISEWYRDRIDLYDSNSEEIDGNEETSLLKIINEMIGKFGCDVILIDNLMTALDLETSLDHDKYERQSQFVKSLARTALATKTLIILVAHKRKAGINEQNSNDEVAGSSDITNLAMITLSYGKNKELLDTERQLIVTKNRLFGKLGKWTMEYDERCKRIYGEGDNTLGGKTWNSTETFVPINDEDDLKFT